MKVRDSYIGNAYYSSVKSTCLWDEVFHFHQPLTAVNNHQITYSGDET